MPKILILEDDFDLAKTWQTALHAKGHTTVLWQSSAEALEHFNRQDFDAVIVDLMISVPRGAPPDSGIHFLRTLKGHSPLPRLIGVSGYTLADDARNTENLLKVYGVEYVLIKPFDAEKLVDLIDAPDVSDMY